ncbi:glycosyltransferase [Actinoplanes utahensis]|uniref:Glycosyl transferase family 28 C-terminal domain-containing protein n=1 Tax=Actinoplanes utahensis TaxID=1869 RepID=A0A0A6WZP4_ACTUT|nr:glycosyltransferase [Actinoplanes utahensis]KHD73232.1 hypothetical protein MB27_36880 [Actinoplanes utahensis]
MTATVHDVAILSDFRLPGDAPAGVAAEIRAQARAGLGTTLVHVRSPLLAGDHPFDPVITGLIRDGSADLAAEGEPVTARLLVVRRPEVLAGDPAPEPRVRSGRAVVVLDTEPGEEVRRRVASLFGAGIEWAPVSPLVRAELLRADPGRVLAEADWHEVVDGPVRQGEPVPRGPVPVIGWHAPSGSSLPDSPDLQVRVLADPGAAGSLAGLDFFVHFPDPDRPGASGRAVLEAMAAGVPVIVDERFRPMFGDAAFYSDPAGVPELVHRLYGNREHHRAIGLRGREFAGIRYGPAAHLARLADRGVRPGASPSPALPASRTAPNRGVLLVSDNGAGPSSLSRLMAIGRRLPEGTPVVVATQSHGAVVAHREGFLTEYIPSPGVLGLPREPWSELLRSRLEHLIDLHRPAVVAVDGVPHDGIVAAAEARPGITWVWVRRSMWRRGAGHEWLDRRRVFRHVLEPGEFASAADEGVTVTDRDGVRVVGPITYLDRAELAGAEEARAALGLAPGRPAALVQVGDGDLDDISTPAGRIARHLRGAGFQVVPAGPNQVRHYPISRYLRGFDLVVSGSGYDLFHELIGFEVPAVFVPDPGAALDDQVNRARFAAAAGAALIVEDPGGDDLDEVLRQAVRQDVRDALRRRCAEVALDNGAAEAAGWLAGLVWEGSVAHA